MKKYTIVCRKKGKSITQLLAIGIVKVNGIIKSHTLLLNMKKDIIKLHFG